MRGGYVHHCFGNEIGRIKRKAGPHGNDDVGFPGVSVPVQPEGLFDYPLDSVPGDRSFQLSADADSDAIVATVVGEVNDGESFSVQPFAMPVYRFEFPVLPQQTIFRKTKLPQRRQAESRLRPLALRALIMARPALVLIRARKPWLLFRFILLG